MILNSSRGSVYRGYVHVILRALLEGFIEYTLEHYSYSWGEKIIKGIAKDMNNIQSRLE